MKIVINDDFGGFSLSPQGLEEYARLKGIEKLYWFRIEGIEFGGMSSKLVPVENRPDARSFPIHVAHTVPEPDNHTISFSNRDIPRDDPDLVSVVEKLGEKANGSSASLRVVEIPDDVDWIISEYDGLEHIAENHRTWS